ncbi:unnamed protein product [Meloidogyne enterolobii]|uniref:Uncharacterized protein n=3 Tax=Meloidogyne enterolobii TaxID=390850 RepID=A0ACB0Y163_MELEN
MNSSQLWKVPYFHGLIDRSDAFDLLTNNGDYLVRMSKKEDKQILILSSIQQNIETNIEIFVRNNLYYFDFNKQGYTTLQNLIESQINNKEENQIVLKKPINRMEWELCQNDLEIGKVLGSGMFGIVKKARLKGRFDVAVKQDLNNSVGIYKEASILKNLNHDNIVRLFGITLDQEPMLLVLEFCSGCLLDYLKLNTNLKNYSKLILIKDAANGVDYLHEHNIIHCDLAARNCLMDKTLKIKITDFGLSTKLKDEEEINVEKKAKLPIPYLAPETFIRKILSKKTDVYSFGVLNWEIFTNGKVPFKGLTDLEIARKIVNAEYLTFPTNTPNDFISKIIKNIFTLETKRFLMKKILIELKNIIKKSEEGENKLKSIENKGRKRK